MTKIKKTKDAATAAQNIDSTSTTAETPQAPATPEAVPTPVVQKIKRTKQVIPLTPAQEAARAALAQADQQAREDLLKNSEGRIAELEDVIKKAQLAEAEAKVQLKLIRKAAGIVIKGNGTPRVAFKSSSVLIFVQDFPAGKGAPQARQILEIVKAGGTTGMKREKIVETMKTVINTKMDRSRLLSYYTSRMIQAGVIRMSETALPSPANSAVPATNTATAEVAAQ